MEHWFKDIKFKLNESGDIEAVDVDKPKITPKDLFAWEKAEWEKDRGGEKMETNKQWKPCQFRREDYLEHADRFESIKMYDVTNELCEFNDDAEDLAFELAYMRYGLAKLEDRLFALGEMNNPPCFVCGYNGPNYFQPSVHKCAERHHKLLEVRDG